MKLYLFQTVPLSIIRSFFTVHTAMVYVIHVCWQLGSKLSANLYDIYHCCVYSEKTSDDGQRNCPKQVEFHSKNKSEKLVHLVGFIIINLARCTVTWTSNSSSSYNRLHNIQAYVNFRRYTQRELNAHKVLNFAIVFYVSYNFMLCAKHNGEP